MILFHTEENELSTDQVIQYYLYQDGKEFQRYNDKTPIDGFALEMNSEADVVKFSSDAVEYKVDESVRVFYRRGIVQFNEAHVRSKYGRKDVDHFTTEELKTLRNYTSISLHTRKAGFGNYFDELSNNKLDQLNAARNAGLKIPATLITNDKKNLEAFAKKHDSLIYKPISNHQSIKSDNRFIAPQGTKMVDEEFMNQLPDAFFPTLFQETVQKEFEIRIFLFNETFYSSAIFSQNNKKTSLDFRNYDSEKANRIVPFKLPKTIEQNLQKTYEALGWKTGSADLILTKSGEYVFLEINSLGQFGWVTKACNYNIEKKMADYLCEQ